MLFGEESNDQSRRAIDQRSPRRMLNFHRRAWIFVVAGAEGKKTIRLIVGGWWTRVVMAIVPF